MAKKVITNLHDIVASTAASYIYANKEEFRSTVPGPQGLRGIPGADGKDGTSVTITSVLNNIDKSLTINFSDGTQHTTDPLKGEDGRSVTITNVINNANGTMLINFSDGTSHHTADLRGPQGFKGDTGDHVHHISYQRSKDPLGNEVGPVTPSQKGNTDTYAMWASQEELPEMYIGEFTVYNGLNTLTAEEQVKFDSIEFGATADQEAFEVPYDNSLSGLLSEDVQNSIDELSATKLNLIEKGQPNGVASLDSNGLVPSTQLPSYVDDVLEVDTYADLPVSGESDKIYVVVTDETQGNDVSSYRWTGTTYALVSNTLTSADVKAMYESQPDKVLTDVNIVGLSTDTTLAAGLGQFAWNVEEATVDLGLSGATLQLGQEQLVRVRNNTASSISNGNVVMATGTLGNSGRITVGLANLTQANGRMVLGVVTETIAAGADGFCTVFGKVRGINTTGSSVGENWLDGDVLYVKDSGNGALTKEVPTSTQLRMPIAIVVHAHAAGTLFVRATGIDENHDKAELASKAPLANPALTGIPTAPTAAVGTSTTQLATTEFVAAEINKIEEW